MRKLSLLIAISISLFSCGDDADSTTPAALSMDGCWVKSGSITNRIKINGTSWTIYSGGTTYGPLTPTDGDAYSGTCGAISSWKKYAYTTNSLSYYLFYQSDANTLQSADSGASYAHACTQAVEDTFTRSSNVASDCP